MNITYFLASWYKKIALKHKTKYVDNAYNSFLIKIKNMKDKNNILIVLLFNHEINKLEWKILLKVFIIENYFSLCPLWLKVQCDLGKNKIKYILLWSPPVIINYFIMTAWISNYSGSLFSVLTDILDSLSLIKYD